MEQAIKCTSCKKEVATDYVRCTPCGNLFHPGCYKPHKIVSSTGEKTTCNGPALPVKRCGLPAPPAPPLTPAATSHEQTPSSSELTLSAVLTAVQNCTATLSAFQANQEKHNLEAEGQISGLRKDLAGRLDRLSTDLRSVAARIKAVESTMVTMQGDIATVSTKHEEFATSVTSRLAEIEKRQQSYCGIGKGPSIERAEKECMWCTCPRRGD